MLNTKLQINIAILSCISINKPIANISKIVFKIKFCYKLDSVTVDSIYRVENL